MSTTQTRTYTQGVDAKYSSQQKQNNPIRRWMPVAGPVDPAKLQREMKLLAKKTGNPLATQGGLEVYLSRSQAIPSVMLEIGRLRELTFRQVGEGTGKAVDLNRFDNHYLHLILWDPANRKVAGAYRMGLTDSILTEYGPEGLVTASFFEFEAPFLEYLTPGLELGRAFVAPEYQKSIYPLSLLWRGIGAFIVRNPRYHKLFGCVSISDDYTRISQDMMVRYMRGCHTNSDLARWVHPHQAYQSLDNCNISNRLENIEQVSAAVAETEADGKGVPVLLRQYLKLNATLLEFNVDPKFNNTLDALVLVDMREAPEKMLQRYLGKEGCKAMGR